MTIKASCRGARDTVSVISTTVSQTHGDERVPVPPMCRMCNDVNGPSMADVGLPHKRTCDFSKSRLVSRLGDDSVSSKVWWVSGTWGSGRAPPLDDGGRRLGIVLCTRL
jgi:hypothetical protein